MASQQSEPLPEFPVLEVYHGVHEEQIVEDLYRGDTASDEEWNAA